MKEIKTTFKCDRCKRKIDNSGIFKGRSRRTMEADIFELQKLGYIPGPEMPMPEENILCLYIDDCTAIKIGKIDLCSKCTKKFKKFMSQKD